MKKKKSSILLLICVVLAVTLTIGCTLLRKNYYKPSTEILSAGLSEKLNSYFMPLKLIAHRGFSGIAPENTLAAVKAAGTADYYGCEFDIRLTADNRWVVLHNNDVSTMTDGEGTVSQMTFDEIKKLTIDAGENVIQYPTEKIPSLEEMLDACKKHALIPVIELKLEAEQTPDYAALARIIREKGFENCYIISFHSDALTDLAKHLPSAEYWLLTNKVTTQLIAECKEKGIHGINFNASKIHNLRYVNAIADAGLVVGAWTVDNIHLLDKLYSKGVYYITTNRITPV